MSQPTMVTPISTLKKPDVVQPPAPVAAAVASPVATAPAPAPSPSPNVFNTMTKWVPLVLAMVIAQAPLTVPYVTEKLGMPAASIVFVILAIMFVVASQRMM